MGRASGATPCRIAGSRSPVASREGARPDGDPTGGLFVLRAAQIEVP